MNISLSFIRILFIGLSILFLTTYTITALPGGMNSTNALIGILGGLFFGAALCSLDFIFKKANLRTFNIAILGILFGYLMGTAIVLVFNAVANMSVLEISKEAASLVKTAIYLFSIYVGMSLTSRAAEGIYLSIPFIKLKATNLKKKDILVDWSVLNESRIIDLATSGLLDDFLIIPRFMLKELYAMLESSDEMTRNKARRCLDVFKKLEGIPALELRFSDSDFPDIKDPALKLIQLARLLDANIITSDISRFQQSANEGIRIINIHMLSNALKPITGEQLAIKVQRYGKEPLQGVGYLEDGTMVVINGGAEFIGDTIKAHVLSVKHTSTGRMIFCNVADEMMLASETSNNHPVGSVELSPNHKSFYSLQ